jgi:hypothetical protein
MNYNKEQAKRYRDQAHKRVESQIVKLKEDLVEAEANRTRLHEVLDRIPKELWALSGFYGGESFWITVPWDWTLIDHYEKKIAKNGFVLTDNWACNDGKDLYHGWRYYYANQDEAKGIFRDYFTIGITVSANHPDSKCVLVPLKTEMKKVVTAYDHICPDAHPELFKRTEDGKWEYVGDDLFPAIKMEEDNA